MNKLRMVLTLALTLTLTVGAGRAQAQELLPTDEPTVNGMTQVQWSARVASVVAKTCAAADSVTLAPENLRVLREHPELNGCQLIAMRGIYQTPLAVRCVVKIGSSAACVFRGYGRPGAINRTTVASGVEEQWVYDRPDRYVYLRNGIVSGIQERSPEE